MSWTQARPASCRVLAEGGESRRNPGLTPPYFRLLDGKRSRAIPEGPYENTPRKTLTMIMNPVVHFELPYDDRERIARFYGSVFGWQLQMLGEDMGSYVLATTASSDARPGAPAGAIDGGFFPRRTDWPAQHPSVVIAVPDIDAAMAGITAAGGEVLGEPMDIPGVGRYVSFHDTEKNRLSILQPATGKPSGA